MEKQILKLYLEKRDLMTDREREVILKAIDYMSMVFITGKPDYEFISKMKKDI